MSIEAAKSYAAEARQRATFRADYNSSNRFAAAARRADELILVARICRTEAERSLPAVINVVNNWSKRNG